MVVLLLLQEMLHFLVYISCSIIKQKNLAGKVCYSVNKISSVVYEAFVLHVRLLITLKSSVA